MPSLLFLTFSVLVANPKKILFYPVANPARGLLNRKKIESLAVYKQPGQYASSIGRPNDANIIMAEMRQMTRGKPRAVATETRSTGR